MMCWLAASPLQGWELDGGNFPGALPQAGMGRTVGAEGNPPRGTAEVNQKGACRNQKKTKGAEACYLDRYDVCALGADRC